MNSQYSNLIFIALMIGVFYFLMIRPQQQRTKRHDEMLSALKPGDEIVTIGGIYGRVVSIGERVRIRIADGAELEVAKAAVSSVVAHESDSAMEMDRGDEDDTASGPGVE